MKVIEKYSHLNGEEHLLVHHKKVFKEILDLIKSVDAKKFQTKVSKEKTMKGKLLYNPKKLNREFKRLFKQNDW